MRGPPSMTRLVGPACHNAGVRGSRNQVQIVELGSSIWNKLGGAPADLRVSVDREAANPEVVMPQDPRRDGAVWPPSLRHLPELRERWPLRQIRDLHRGGRERLVAVRPDVGTEQAHRQIDVGGPSPDATQLNELRADGVVRQAC